MAVILLTEADDSFTGTSKTDEVRGLGGDDVISGLRGDDSLWGEDGDDTLLGGGGADRLFGGAGLDTLLGGDGDDRLFAVADGDRLDGGAGTDRASYVFAESGVGVDLGAGTGPDTLVSIERIDGSQLGDLISGDDGPNRLRGLGGADVLQGGGGDDILIGGERGDRLEGGAGDDLLTGGRGDHLFRDDVFVIRAETAGGRSSLVSLGSDLIGDFTPGEDRLELAFAWDGGGIAGAALFERLDTDGDGVLGGADAQVAVRRVEHEGVRALSTVIDLGAVIDPGGGFRAVVTLWGVTGIAAGDIA